MLDAGALDRVVGRVSEGERDYFSDMAIKGVVVVVACRSHPIFRKRVRRFADLLEIRWTLRSPALGSCQWIDNAFESRGQRKPMVQIESTSVQLLLREHMPCAKTVWDFLGTRCKKQYKAVENAWTGSV